MLCYSVFDQNKDVNMNYDNVETLTSVMHHRLIVMTKLIILKLNMVPNFFSHTYDSSDSEKVRCSNLYQGVSSSKKNTFHIAQQ